LLVAISAVHLGNAVVWPNQAEGNASVFKSTSTSLSLLGILAVIAGIIAIAWPGVTVYALVILFPVYAFLAARSGLKEQVRGDRKSSHRGRTGCARRTGHGIWAC